MRLQQTVNSPTQSRIIQHKQAEIEGIIKTQLISGPLKQRLIIPSPSFHLLLLFLLCLFCLISPFSLLSSLPLANSFLSPSVHPFNPPSPPNHSGCLGNNTKTFSSQLCHRGNAWLSSRPLLNACRPPAGFYWPPSNRGHPSAGSRLTADAAISESGGDAGTPRWRVGDCWVFSTTCFKQWWSEL